MKENLQHQLIAASEMWLCVWQFVAGVDIGLQFHANIFSIVFISYANCLKAVILGATLYQPGASPELSSCFLFNA